jgi:hypothetical protein
LRRRIGSCHGQLHIFSLLRHPGSVSKSGEEEALQKNYSPFSLEAAAAVWDFFNEYPRGKQFILYTDHKPL